jgi:hypothetical protein
VDSAYFLGLEFRMRNFGARCTVWYKKCPTDAYQGLPTVQLVLVALMVTNTGKVASGKGIAQRSQLTVHQPHMLVKRGRIIVWLGYISAAGQASM